VSLVCLEIQERSVSLTRIEILYGYANHETLEILGFNVNLYFIEILRLGVTLESFEIPSD